jgi:arylsulfatase A-like enzyme
MVKRLDEALGRTVDALTSLNLLDDTIILFTCDHGNHFKTRNGEYKRSCHDASLRVPTALSGPGFNSGGRVGQLVSLVDLPPTLLDACGIPVPSHMAGRSIRPLLNEHFRSSNNWPDDVFAQVSESEVGRVVRTARWKYAVTDSTKNGWKDSASDQYTETYLYDLKADPWELNNLVGKASHDNVTKVMRERLTKHLKRVENATPKILPASPRPAGQALVSDEDARG